MKNFANFFSKIILIFILFLFLAVYYDKNISQKSFTDEDEAKILGFENNFKVKGYQVAWFNIKDLSKINLYENISKKLPSQALFQRYSCEKMVSSGFFSEKGIIGLFVTENNILNDAVKSDIFNGYFYIFEDKAYISNEKPKNTPRIALQSGPILFYEGKPALINIKNDEKARRIVIATTSDNQVLFLSFYKSDNFFHGPFLTELPEIIQELKINFFKNLENALNLDGGTHSVFISNNYKLTEASTIGGFFCIKN